jgi:hypothetical protein
VATKSTAADVGLLLIDVDVDLGPPSRSALKDIPPISSHVIENRVVTADFVIVGNRGMRGIVRVTNSVAHKVIRSNLIVDTID